MGESGSGKTTLLNILAALDRPTEGEVFLNGRALSTIGEKEIASFRRQNLGFVFQDFNLLDTFTLQDNIFLPLVLAGKHFPEMQAKLLPLAQQLGIANLLQKYPYEVSGGQKQRAAVARALITSPQILLADEPTGALDSRASDSLLSLFGEINRAGQTILMVTHSTKYKDSFAPHTSSGTAQSGFFPGYCMQATAPQAGSSALYICSEWKARRLRHIT